MKTLRLLTMALAVGLLAGGCESTGLSPRESHNHYPAAITGLYRLDREPPGPITVPLPLRLAVAQLGEAAPPNSLIKALEAEQTLISSVAPVPIRGSIVSRNPWDRRQETVDLAELETNLRSTLNLARDLNAQYLFVLGGAIDSYKANPLIVFDLTVIGSVLIPGQTIHSEGKISGVLVDTATERAAFIVSSDCRKRAGAPTLLAEGAQQDHLVAVRDELVGKLGEALLSRLRQLQTADLRQ